jgi:2-C-methyl-D-erythritol 4-phosphate cytidylyltransferase
MPASFAVILPAAGKSSRFKGKEKKPFVTLDGRAVWIRSAELFVNRPDVKQILIVIAPEDAEKFKDKFAANLMFMNIQVVEGGAERFESVANALARLSPEIDFVAVHDAVRPCAPAAVIDTVFQTAEKCGAALPGVPVADTIKQVNNAMEIEATHARAGLWLAQTPQVFRRDWLEEAYQKRGEFKGTITDDAQLVEAAGRRVRIVPGAIENLKITSAEDLAMADRYLKSRKPDPVKPRGPFDDDLFR